MWFRNDNSDAASTARRRRQPRPEADAAVRPVRPVRPAADADDDQRSISRASGFQVQQRARLQPAGHLGHRLRADRRSTTGDKEQLAEGYYNFQLSERLRLSFTLQHVLRRAGRATASSAILLPGMRLQAASNGSSGQEDKHGNGKTRFSSPVAAGGHRRRARWQRVRLQRGRRQDRRPDVGRHDRQSRLERHRVHGHQDQEDGRQGVPRQQRQPAHGDDVAGRPLRRHRRHARQQGVHHRRADAAAGEGDPGGHRAGAPGVLAGQPLVLPGQSGRRFDLGDRHGVADEDQDDSRLRRAAQRRRSCPTARRPTSATTARTGSASSTSGATSC